MSATKPGNLKKEIAFFVKTDTKTSLMQIFNTIIPFGLLWYAAYASLSISYALTFAIAVIASGFLIRTFILFHDCCHQSFFKSRRANDLLGTLTGVLTHVPYRRWKHDHAVHHATSGNLSKRGIGDIWLLTVEEYAKSPWWRRICYWFYRNPLVMFGLGPIAVFLIQYRFNRRGASRKERINTWMTNLLIAAMYVLLYFAVGWQALLAVQLPIFYLSGVFGIWLFYVQHNFEHSYFEQAEEWNYVLAAVEGSSFYKLPKLLQWLTGNIGYHHVHHLDQRVPNYHLEQAHHASPDLQKVPKITLVSSLKSLRYKLWDEAGKTFLSFNEAKPLVRAIRSNPKLADGETAWPASAAPNHRQGLSGL